MWASPRFRQWRELANAASLLTSGALPATRPALAGGEPVLLVPGLFAFDGSLSTLASGLSARGHAPVGAGIPRNIDCSEATAKRLLNRLEPVAEHYGRRIALVGHSRGGMLARVLAQRRPDLVSGVVALGSPQRAPLAVHPALWAQLVAIGTAGSLGIGGLLRFSCAAGLCCERFRADLLAPLPDGIGYLSIYSRADGIVDWRACLDPDGRHVEVTTGHCEMPAHGATLELVAQAIERFADDPYRSGEPAETLGWTPDANGWGLGHGSRHGSASTHAGIGEPRAVPGRGPVL